MSRHGPVLISFLVMSGGVGVRGGLLVVISEGGGMRDFLSRYIAIFLFESVTSL